MNPTISICRHCDQTIPPKEVRWWRWAGWQSYGAADSAPQRAVDVKLDEWDWSFHKGCLPTWLENRNGFLQDLDRPVNSCIYFNRTGSSAHGYYVRDGKKHPCLAAWLEYDILGTSVIPTILTEIRLDLDCVKIVMEPKAFLRSFQEFLNKNGWLNAGWYEPRKAFVVK